jgi:inorganic pyrophosphatase
MFNPWHEVAPKPKTGDTVNAIIEIPRGARAKYELDKDSGMLRLDRVLYSSVYYPHNYGFIPGTYGDDKDPLDILVISQVEVVPLCLLEAKVIGVMRMLDNGEGDDKIIAVAAQDMSVTHYTDISELPSHTLKELQSFFEDYKKLENKEVVVEEFLGPELAKEIIEKAISDYNETFKRRQ